jgi:hypothetical protein
MGGSEARGQGAHRQRVVSEKGWGRHVATGRALNLRPCQDRVLRHLEAAGDVRGRWGARGAPKRVARWLWTWVALGGSLVGPRAGVRGSGGRVGARGRVCADFTPDGRPGSWHICPPVAYLWGP